MSASYVARRISAITRRRALRHAVHTRNGHTGPRPAVVGAVAPGRRMSAESPGTVPYAALDAAQRAERQWTVPRPPRRAAIPQDDRAGLTIRVAWDVVDGPEAEAVEARQSEALVRLLRWMLAGARDAQVPVGEERMVDVDR
jgi:hypothetical protein